MRVLLSLFWECSFQDEADGCQREEVLDRHQYQVIDRGDERGHWARDTSAELFGVVIVWGQCGVREAEALGEGGERFVRIDVKVVLMLGFAREEREQDIQDRGCVG